MFDSFVSSSSYNYAFCVFQEDESESTRSQLESITEESSGDLVDGPDTSSFPAFLYSLWSAPESENNPYLDEQVDNREEKGNSPSDSKMKENGGKRSLISKGKQTLGRAIYQAARISGFRNQERKGDSNLKNDDGSDATFAGVEMKPVQKIKEPVPLLNSPDISEPSLLLSENLRCALYGSLPALVQGRKWLLLYRFGKMKFLPYVIMNWMFRNF